jgi:hypothetical protein
MKLCKKHYAYLYVSNNRHGVPTHCSLLHSEMYLQHCRQDLLTASFLHSAKHVMGCALEKLGTFCVFQFLSVFIQEI